MTDANAEWTRCREWIKAAVEPSGLYLIEDIEAALAAGAMDFWPGKHAAAVTEFIAYPNCKALNVFAGGGARGKALKELKDVFEPCFLTWAKEAGCKKIMGFGISEAWKPICEGMGYSHLWTVMSKDIG